MGPRQQNIINEPTVVGHSTSIALLQERFKQLERVKVMRQERQQQRQPNWPFLHTELLRPSRSLVSVVPVPAPSSSRLDTFSRYDRPEFRALEASLCSTGLFRHETISSRPASMHNRNTAIVGEAHATDIDTSLHL